MNDINPGSNLWSASVTSSTRIIAGTLIIFLAGCGSVLKRDVPGKGTSASGAISSAAKRGGYYLDDGPGHNPPPDLASIPDATPRDEPLRPANMRPYVALGKWYTPRTILEPYREKGIASWYGRRYHGLKTASGELYDMYGMTAAHPTLPIPSYARVTNIRNGRSVVVRVNDRGPFLSERLIDLSYTAAYKLDVLGGGSAWVEVETILPGATTAMQVAAAQASARGSGSTGKPARTSNAERLPSHTVTAVGEKGNLSSAAEQQKEEDGPDLFEITDPPAQYGTTVSGSGEGPATTDAGGIYLQLGAFSAYDNADNFLARMRAELPTVNALGIIAKDGLFKVHAGPYPDQTMARQAADKIAQSLSIRPLLLTR
ncbi:septal ring lytic transglycosylase RlpA family protein [Nitrosospira sp. Is2]|nr:septal ring lytic transglycosylase RlpA family protein [Nitrosospira sp. Is2]WON75024.1 septal ring lytic transglycosylase RlpA family protein [Nitrosospira sp. Is2]